jgi:hypothetical protein
VFAWRVREVTVVVPHSFESNLSVLSIDAQGGALVNLIHGYTDNGDPFVRRFTDQLLEEVSPCRFYDLMYLHVL